MAEDRPAPFFSIIIAVYNDWALLNQCLSTLAQQKGSDFEVVLVDDGSAEAAPEYILDWRRSFPLRVSRRPHQGIPAARNYGIKISEGPILVFMDADCRPQIDCLSALASAISNAPSQDSFQMRLIGDCSNLVGRAEELRLIETQKILLQEDGRIRYLNTAGFAIRRTLVDVKRGLFEPAALRAEDTLLLVRLIQSEQLPLFVGTAVVQHTIPLTFLQCLRKDVRSAFLEARTFRVIASLGGRVRVNNRVRVRILWSTWKTSATHSIGRSAWFVLVTRQTLQRSISFAYWCLRGGTYSRETARMLG
jgi:cellulose synthase/poly-beta-1,6-N-acetylglucosamine synthase-like glycosyltransferase